MKRRNFLAAAGSAGAAAIAGCSGLGSETISNPSEEQVSDGETVLTFQADNGDQVATLTIQPAKQQYSGKSGQQVPVDIAITHPEETSITDLTLSLRAPPAGTGVSEIALETPFGTPHPSIELFADEDGASVLSIDDMGENGDGNVVFKFVVIGYGDTISELEVDAEIELAESGFMGQEYTLNGLALVPLPDDTT